MPQSNFVNSCDCNNYKNKLISKRHEQLIEKAIQIEREDARTAGAIGYMAQVFVQLTLPHERTNSLYYETPPNGNLSLSIRAHKAYGVPYGAKARLIMAWLVTEAVRTQSPELLLGRSQRDFAMNKLGMSYTGRELIALRNQCLALVRSIISIDVNAHSNTLTYQDIQLSNKGFICWSENPYQQGLWESTILLTDDFYKTATQNPVPIDLRVYKALSKSPMNMDIYAWFLYRMFTLWRSGRPKAMIPWVGLKKQFGHEYADTPRGMLNFKNRFKLRAMESLRFLPEFLSHIEETKNHLILMPCNPIIEPTKAFRIVHKTV